MSVGRLTLGDREEISLGVGRGEGPRAIGRLLGRPASTVSRELRRSTADGGVYRAVTGQACARLCARRPKRRIIDTNQRLHTAVVKGLTQRWSPEQISIRLAVDHPNEEGMRVSHETIYTWFYVLPKGELKAQLLAGLRRHRAHRVTRARIPSGRGHIAGMVSIDERPAEVTDRKVPGHWEGDLIIGKAGSSAVGTLVERTTRFTMLVPLPDGRKSDVVRTAVQGTLSALPTLLVRSLTWDQGKELAQHQQFTVDTGVAVYFAHPHSPWERGSNENTNGLLRQYLPKGTVLPDDAEPLDAIAASLNGRPRRTLNGRTPAEAFAELVTSGVALTP